MFKNINLLFIKLDKILKKNNDLINFIKYFVLFVSIFFIFNDLNFLELKKYYYSIKFNYDSIFKINLYLCLGFFLYSIRFIFLINTKDKKYKFSKTLEINLYSNLASQFGILINFIVRMFLSYRIKIKSKKIFFVTLKENILTLIFFCFLGSIYLIYYKFNFILTYLFSIILFYLFFQIILKKYLITFLITIILNLINFLVIYETSNLIGISITREFIFLIPLVVFLVSVPLSVTEWGWREMLFIKIFSIAALSSEQAFMLSILYGFITLFFSIIIIFVYFFQKLIRSSFYN